MFSSISAPPRVLRRGDSRFGVQDVGFEGANSGSSDSSAQLVSLFFSSCNSGEP